MRTWRLPMLALTVGVSLVVALAASAGQSAVPTPAPAFTAEDLVAPSGDNWLGYNGNIYNQRYSTLEQINARNVQEPQGRVAEGDEAAGHEGQEGRGPVRRDDTSRPRGRPLHAGRQGEPLGDRRRHGRADLGDRGCRSGSSSAWRPFGLLNRGAAIGDGKVYLARPTRRSPPTTRRPVGRCGESRSASKLPATPSRTL